MIHNHFLAVPVIPNLVSRTSSSRLWSTVLNASLKSSITIGVTSCLSIFHSILFTSLTRLVSQL